MIELLIKDKDKFEEIMKSVSNVKRKFSFERVLTAIAIYSIYKTIKSNQKKIANLHKEIKELKSKGE
jgi:hypothetical protein